MNLPHLILLCVLIAVPEFASAQRGCPEGYYEQNAPGLNSCIPIPSGGDLPPTGPKWIKTWGAIAVEPGGSNVGVSVRKESKFDAKRAAMKACKEGGHTCKIVLAYNHQCAAIADIENPQASDRSRQGYAAGPDKAISGQDAITACASLNPGRSCKVIYSDCTTPILAP